MSIKRLGLGFAALLWVTQVSTALAEEAEELAMNTVGIEEIYGDETFVSIATGGRKPIEKAPATASVITAAQIEAMGARNLNDVLETVPGLHVMPSTINRLDPGCAIRGIHTGLNPQTLMLMNGVPLMVTVNGNLPPQFRLPVSSIARVEVIRGPGSAIYGADAFAGVVNVITKGADDIAGTATGFRGGSFDTQDVWLEHGATHGGWKTALNFEYQHSDGDRDRRIESDYQTLLDRAMGTNYSLAPGPLETHYDVFDTHLDLERNNWNLRLWNWVIRDAGEGAGGIQALDPEGRQDHVIYQADLSYRNDTLARDWIFTANLNYLYLDHQEDQILLPPGSLGLKNGMVGSPGAISQQTGLDLSAVYEGWTGHRWRLGGGVRYLDADTNEFKNFGEGVPPGVVTDVSDTPYVFLADTWRTLAYLSLQDEWRFAADWELTAGVRYDHYSDFGETLNPRLALVWSTAQNLTSKLLYGRAFRAPSFMELHTTNNPAILGNEGLDPETIDTVELAFDYRPTFDIQLVPSLFGYRANGLIEYVPDPGQSTNTARNARDQEGYGFEFEWRWEATQNLSLNGNYAWQHSEDAETGEHVAEVPGQQALLAADWGFAPKWTLHPQIKWVGDRERDEFDPRDEIDDYALVDLTLRRKEILKHWELALAVRNLFDKDAREPSSGPAVAGEAVVIPDDYPLEGRSVWAEARYRF